mgnify:CR=1 FL=1
MVVVQDIYSKEKPRSSYKGVSMKNKPDFILELQKLASENEDVLITVDENGEVEFEMDEELFVEFLKLQWLQEIERDYS